MDFFLVAKKIKKRKAAKKLTEVQSSLNSGKQTVPGIHANIFLGPEAHKKVITQKD